VLSVKKILIPTDFSEQSDRAFDTACTLFAEPGVEMIVMHVVPLAALMYCDPSESYLDNLFQKLKQIQTKNPKNCVRHLLVEGNVAATILREAKDMNCDAIVMGTHGRTGVNRFIIGSVAEAVVRKATCPVVTVKTPVPSGRSADDNGKHPAACSTMEADCLRAATLKSLARFESLPGAPLAPE
jgi:nucleotide-binding universal stress UspA family protein